MSIISYTPPFTKKSELARPCICGQKPMEFYTDVGKKGREFTLACVNDHCQETWKQPIWHATRERALTAWNDEKRILENLKWLKENPLPVGAVWSAWKQDVESEAIKLGLVSGVQVGCNCPSVNCPEPVYGGDMADVF